MQYSVFFGHVCHRMSYFKWYRKNSADLQLLLNQNIDSDSSLDRIESCEESTDKDLGHDDFGYNVSPISDESDTGEVTDQDLENLTSNLASWSINHNCTRSYVNDLLAVLRNSGFNLPKDSRTLLGQLEMSLVSKMWRRLYLFWD